jgi:hypothetical protein
VAALLERAVERDFAATIPDLMGRRTIGDVRMSELSSGELLVTLVNSKHGLYGHRLFARVAPSF